MKFRMEMKYHRYGVTDVDVFKYSTIEKRRLIRKWILRNVKDGRIMFIFLKLKVMHHNIIVIQVLETVNISSHSRVWIYIS